MARHVSFLPIAPHRIRVPEVMEVTLTDVEEQLCTLLDDCTKHISETKGIHTSCRIAGGWVRDKLLGSDSNDIDIALEDTMGHPFAVEFSEFASKVKNIHAKPVTTVKGNPNQSKHLETAKTSVLGLDLDFVNLRAEEYADSSRIPTAVTYGTPLQDALRRDTTINALFYNIHTRSVEDHCGTGIEDLKKGIIRTPLPPRQTFLDDPLRVIRCIRFASRFGFDLVPELEDCARNTETQVALTQKITRERVGEEVDKMMAGRDPLRSIYLIDSLALFSAIFHIPPSITLSTHPAPSAKSVAAASILRTFLQPELASFSHPPLHPFLTSKIASSSSLIPRLYLACALTPYEGITYKDTKKRDRPAVEAAIREGLKVGTKNHYLDGIPALFDATHLIRKPELGSEKLQNPSERVAIGLLLRQTTVHNPPADSHWTYSVLFSLVQELAAFYDFSNDQFDVESATACIQTYNDFVRRITELHLDSSVDAKSILDGREVAAILESNPGQWTGHVLAEVVKWQLGHPEGMKQECADWLKAEHAVGKFDAIINSTGNSGKRGQGVVQENKAKKSKR